MKHTSIFKLSLPATGLLVLLLSAGCKKESASTPKQVSTLAQQVVDSTYYLKGMLGSQPVKIEGNNVYYSGIDTTISTGQPWGNCNGGLGNSNPYQNGGPPSTVYVTGTKWITTGTSSTQTTVGSVELRSLDVRIFVTPSAQLQTQYFDMLKANISYTLASASNPQQGAYITILDENGVRWTSIGAQAGSTFKITAVGSNTPGVLYTTFSGVFSVNVYDGNGNVKQLSNVTFSAEAGL